LLWPRYLLLDCENDLTKCTKITLIRWDANINYALISTMPQNIDKNHKKWQKLKLKVELDVYTINDIISVLRQNVYYSVLY